MRLLHTADWHLGHTLHDMSRQHEHAHFLSWLLDTLEREAVDVLVIAGDVFETANPRAEALHAWYDFIAALRERRFRDLEVLVIGGNHDSARRLDAPRALYRFFGFHVIGGVPYRTGDHGRRVVDHEAMVVPLRDRTGRVAAWCCAVPFPRASDLPAVADAGPEGPLVAGFRKLLSEVTDVARAKRKPDQALIAAAHLMLADTALSPDSERKVQGGNRHAVPVDAFDDDLAYVALGHLHRAQAVGGREHVRYSGSPIPLSMTEAGYAHQVLVVDVEGPDVTEIRTLRVPRLVDMIRIPEAGSAPLPQVLAELQSLPKLIAANGKGPSTGSALHPYVAVHVTLDAPEPTLREQIEGALKGRAARLIKIVPSYTGPAHALADAKPAHLLDDLTLDEVFVERYRRDFDRDPPQDLMAAYHELAEQVLRDAAPDRPALKAVDREASP